MDTIVVGVKFCGHCQPRRDMVALIDALHTAAPELRCVPWSGPEAWQVLLVLQACDAACATPPATDRPRIDVIVSCLNFVEYDEDDALIAAIRSAIRCAVNPPTTPSHTQPVGVAS